EVLGRGVDMERVDIDTYFIAGLNDHIVPWDSAYRSATLFGGRRRFVLSSSGHIQALVNPPSPESRSSFRAADELPQPSRGFLGRARKRRGRWGSDWDAWLAERSGVRKAARKPLGTRPSRARGKARGPYVLAN